MTSSYGPPRRPVVMPYSSQLECRENFVNKVIFNEYCPQITSHLASLEHQCQPNPLMIDLQPEIKWFMRPYLVNFIIQIHSTLKLKPQTLFLSWNIIDRYCAKRIAFKQHYQLIGCTALWIASKYEDKKSRVPTVRELALMCSNVYEDSMFREMEVHILSTLQWSVSYTSLEDVLQLAVKFSDPDGKEQLDQPIQNYKGNSPLVSAILAVSRFLAELSLYDRDFLNWSSSQLGSSIFILACSILNLDIGVNYLSSINQQYLSNFHFFTQLPTPITPIGDKNHCQLNDFFFDDDDNDNDDENEQDSENLHPLSHQHHHNNNNIKSSFLNGFHGLSTLDDVRKISTLLIDLMQSPSEVLIEKYEPLGVMTVVKKFLATNTSTIDDLLNLTQLEQSYAHSPSLNASSSYLSSPSNYSSFSSISSNTSYITSNSSFETDTPISKHQINITPVRNTVVPVGLPSP